MKNDSYDILHTTCTKKPLLADAARYHEKHKAYKRADSCDFLLTLVIVVIAVFALRLFVFEPVRVDGQSMQPTLMNNERMFVEKVSLWFGDVERGDIVIVYFPNRGDDTFVKRVVGLPGETLEVRDGRVYIDGEILNESAYWNDFINGDYGPIAIPEGEVFVMGDNRNHSGDSREGGVGPIPIYRIIGRVRGVIWPIANIREV